MMMPYVYISHCIPQITVLQSHVYFQQCIQISPMHACVLFMPMNAISNYQIAECSLLKKKKSHA